MKFLFSLSRDISKYKSLKGTEKGARSKRFGARAVLLAILIVGLAFVIGLCLKMIGSDNFLGVIFGVILMVASALAILISLIRLIMCVVFQFKLNRGFTAYIALFFLFVAIGGAVAAVLLLL